jgi:hypothetical protein
LLSSAIKTSGDMEESELDPQYRCLKAITYVSYSIINDGEETIVFLAFGGFTGKVKKKNKQ